MIGGYPHWVLAAFAFLAAFVFACIAIALTVGRQDAKLRIESKKALEDTKKARERVPDFDLTLDDWY